MTFARVNPLGWALFEVLTSAQMNQLDVNMTNALDGAGGGTYNPGASLILDAIASSGHALEVLSAANGGLHVQVDAGPVGQLIDGTADAIGLQVAQGPITNSAVTPQPAVEITGIGNDDSGGNGGPGIDVTGGFTDGAAGGVGIVAQGGTTGPGQSTAAVGGNAITATGGGAGFVGGDGVSGTGGGGLSGGAGVRGTGGVGDGDGVVGLGNGSGSGGAFEAPGSGPAVFANNTGTGVGLNAIGGTNGRGADITGLGTAFAARFTAGSTQVDNAALDVRGGIDFSNGSVAQRNPAPTDSVDDTLYAKNIIKAWGIIDDGVLVDGFNVASVTINGTDNTYLEVAIGANMADGNYLVLAGGSTGFAGNNPRWYSAVRINPVLVGQAVDRTGGAFQMRQVGNSGTVPFATLSWGTSECYFIVMGEQ